MLRRLRTARPGHATVVAYFAVFLALGASSVAAPVRDAAQRLITGKQVKDGSLNERDLSRKARAQLKGRTGAAGAPGARGDAGATGAKGEAGAAGQDGSDAQFNGASAGGHLAGTYPNPTLGFSVLAPDNFSGSAFPTRRARSTANQVVDNATQPLVHLQTLVHGRQIVHNTGTTDALTCESNDTIPGDCFLTVSRAGTYLITGSVTWAFNAAGMRLIEVNGWTTNISSAFLLARDSRSPVQATGSLPSPQTSQSVTTVRQLQTGQSVSLSAYQDSGAGLAIFGGGDANSPSTLSITWLGPGA